MVRRLSLRGRRPIRPAVDVEYTAAHTAEHADEVYRLWSASIGESSAPPMQLDRWGPGLPVLVDSAGEPVDPGNAEEVRRVAMAVGLELDEESMASALELTPAEPGSAIRAAVDIIAQQPPDGGATLAVLGGAAVGFVAWSVRDHPYLFGRSGAIDMLFVEPEYRRRGIGRGLAYQARDELRIRGVHSIAVETPDDDRPARRFWRQIGWPEYAVLGYYYE